MDDHINADYEADTLLWLERQVELLKARKFDQLDLDNLIDELESMARRDKHNLEHRIEVLILHLLKCQFQPEHISRGWLGTIGEQRARIHWKLEEMPSQKNKVEAYAVNHYSSAVTRAARETGLPKSAFPAVLPYTAQQLLDMDFYPGADNGA